MKTSEIPVHVGSRTHLPSEDIVMIKADISYSHIYMSNGKKMLVSTHLLRLEERFGGQLIRVHRSFLVNPDFPFILHSKTFETINGLHCPVSRRLRKNIENTKIA